MSKSPIRRFVVAASLLLVYWGAPGRAIGLEPRPQIVKPIRTIVDERHVDDVVYVKFRDGLTVRLRDGRLTDLGTGALGGGDRARLDVFGEGTWQRVHREPEAALDEWRQIAEHNLGKEIADPNLEFFLHLEEGDDPAWAIDNINLLDAVEIALPVKKRVSQPSPPFFQNNQVYLNAATDGVGAKAMWYTRCGSIGAGIQIADVECGWNSFHADLPPTTQVVDDAPGNLSTEEKDHGTQVLGVMASLKNTEGTTGIAYGSTFYRASSCVCCPNSNCVNPCTNIPGAITDAISVLHPGDVLLIELQTPGPVSWFSSTCTDIFAEYEQYHANHDDCDWCPGSYRPDCGLVPIEWDLPVYNAVVLAVGNGIIVVEAAGNGSQDLDDPVYSTGNDGHWPFLPENDSGAIIVGAGFTPLSQDCADRSRRHFSNYGSRVDLQGYGHRVYTTGGGNAYNDEGVNNYFATNFSGTSAAAPIVAAACALVQGTYKDRTGQLLSPQEMRDLLVNTGSPQVNGVDCYYGPGNPAAQSIGPRPNAFAAMQALFPFPDCNCNGTDDADDIAGATSTDCSNSGVPDECKPDCNENGTPDECEGAPPPPTPPFTVFVKPSSTGGGDGLSWSTAFSNPQEAFDLASCLPGLNVWVAAGTYSPPGGLTGDREASFVIHSGFAVYGGFAGTETDLTQRDPIANPTILSADIGAAGTTADNSYHVVTLTDTDERTIVDGFQIVDGYADGRMTNDSGAGIMIQGGNPTIANCVFRDCFAAADGGGLYNTNGAPTITSSRFLGNEAGGHGGGLASRTEGVVQLVNTLFIGNAAQRGGGIARVGSAAMGGIRLTSSTLRDNVATLVAGGVYDGGPNADTAIMSSILWNNTDSGGTGQDAQIYVESGGPLVRYSCVQGWASPTADGNINVDPVFASFGGPDEAPLDPSSPAIDRGADYAVPADWADLDQDGDAAEALPHDIAGQPRQVNCIDMGAYEYQTNAFVLGDIDGDGDFDLGDRPSNRS